MSTFQKVIKYSAITFSIFLTIGILTGIVGLISNVTSVFGWEDDYKLNYSKDFTDIEQIDISNGVAKLTIKPGDTFRVEGKNVSDDFKVTVNDGTLIVDEKENFIKIFGLNPRKKFSKTSITVYVPSDFTAQRIKIDCGVGEVSLEDLSTDKLYIDAGVGEIYGRNISASSVTVDGGVGDITFNDVSFSNVDFDSGLGNLKIEGIILGDSKFDCGVGNIKLKINGSRKDYALKLNSGLGNIRINGEKVSSGYNDNYSAPNTIYIDGGVGNVDVDFNY